MFGNQDQFEESLNTQSRFRRNISGYNQGSNNPFQALASAFGGRSGSRDMRIEAKRRLLMGSIDQAVSASGYEMKKATDLQHFKDVLAHGSEAKAGNPTLRDASAGAQGIKLTWGPDSPGAANVDRPEEPGSSTEPAPSVARQVTQPPARKAASAATPPTPPTPPKAPKAKVKKASAPKKTAAAKSKVQRVAPSNPQNEGQ